MIKDIKIGNKTIGLDKDIFISAEVGTTCNGDLATAKKLVDVAKEAGMDAVKFQILDPEDKFSDKDIKFTYTRHNGEIVSENIYKMLKQYVMTFEEWKEIKDYADKKGIIMFATPDYIAAVDLMEELDMPAYKIATWDVTFKPFVEKIASLRKPVIVDLGASDTEEVSNIIKIFKNAGNDKIILLHCFHSKKYEEMNLRSIEYLRKIFNCLSGFSAPDANNDLDYLSLTFKPVYIEKRLTLDRSDPRHHHSQALEPAEMNSYVKRIRELFKTVGNFSLQPTKEDLRLRQEHFRRIVAKKDIKKGEKLTLENLACRRPLANGIDPKYIDIIIGRKIKRNIKENQFLTWDLI